ncbi:MAG: GTPase HflX, partial [Acidobacteriota bacterium]|nr:GTPase HflX [Acidobacteriota bacterium]
QLEADRRMLRVRIKKLKKELTKIEKTREIQRRGRRDAQQVALAGYTNAGKSTLFNRLTRAKVKAEDRLFATLDPRLRSGSIGSKGNKGSQGGRGGGETVIFSDTVGFIRKLPHHLVASFRSTLEEVVHAELVLHVIDRSHPQWEEQTQVAEEVLDDLGVEKGRVLRVFNKRDLLEGPVAYNGSGVWISAVTGEGLDELKKEIRRRLGVGEEPAASVEAADRDSGTGSGVGEGGGACPRISVTS